MREKELNMMKVIDCLIRHNKLKLNSGNDHTEVTFYSIFGIRYDSSKRDYISSDSGFNRKKIDRYVKELTERGIFIKDTEGYYVLNKNNLVKANKTNSPEWQDMLNTALECGELEIYCKIKQFLDVEYQTDYLGETELKNYEISISDNIQKSDVNRDILKNIIDSIKNEYEITIKYKQKLYSVIPICILVSRDGKRSYLCAERKKKLESPFEVSQIQEVTLGNKKSIDREKYMEYIKLMWDTDIKKPTYVNILLRKNFENSCMVYEKLQDYFGYSYKEDEDCAYFQGDVYGINSFKTWIRENLECCIILEPESIRNELINALKEKLKRYEEII